jgi:hypothetical protein
MANGFLEPLDAPGLALTNMVTNSLEKLLQIYHQDIQNKNLYNNILYSEGLNILNNNVKKSYNFWLTFILNQYKTCYRNDTPFWVDHKNIKWDQWDLAVNDLNAYCDIHQNDYDVMMLAQTISSRNIQYNTPLSKHITPLNFPLEETTPSTQHHLDWIKSFHTL